MTVASITITGISALKAKLARAPAKARLALSAGLYSLGHELLERSTPLVPVEFGTLRASGHVDPPKASGTQLEVIVGYGGAAQEYAFWVHERLDVTHPIGQAKFLEEPALAMGPSFGPELAARVGAALGGL